MDRTANHRPPGRPAARRFRPHAGSGLAQLSLVEHALCPLDTAVSLQQGFIHRASYYFTDPNRNRRAASVRIGGLDGISPYDELYLWGILALALAQQDSQADFYATPYYCLRQLGMIDAAKRGGREFELFRAAIKRIAGIRYQNDAFYDPIRGAHRQVSFGFLNYSLPLDPESSRAWRFAWDTIFFELCQATGGALAFDLSLYREFDPATRRLYLFLKKLFWRRERTPSLDLRHVAVDVLGFASSLEARYLKRKLARSIEQLVGGNIVRLPEGTKTVRDVFRKESKSVYTFQLNRGPGFNRAASTRPLAAEDSPLVDPLKAIGRGSKARSERTLF